MISIRINPETIPSGQQSLLDDWSILPSAAVASKLVHFHVRHIAWHHNAVHSPTFVQQCEMFWSSGAYDHPLWIALYLSVLSSSIWCAQNSKVFRAALGIQETERTCETLFRAMVDVLYAENFLGNLSLYSVQAIAISTEVAHNLGLSNLNATLSSAAVRIAQCLGLHKISDAPSLCVTPSDIWHEKIEREIGKRVWCQIVLQDHFAIPFTDSYCISLSHFSTSLPLNCDDHDMEERDDSVPTISSYTRTLCQMAALIPPLLDDLGPLRSKIPRHEQYQRVVKTDHSMRELVSKIPAFLLRQSSDESNEIPWLDIARRSLAITAADKIIMIHRHFLFQSFQTSKYAYTRNTCVSAAITILRQHQQIADADEISIWTHSAFCITAAMVIGLELVYPRKDHAQKLNDYWDLITSAKERLNNRQGDVMANRGARLIDTILKEVEKNRNDGQSDEAPSVDFREVLARFLSLDDSFSATSGEPDVDQFAGMDFSFPPVEDFDVWLNQVFGYEQI
jgi:hypothetical protein